MVTHDGREIGPKAPAGFVVSVSTLGYAAPRHLLAGSGVLTAPAGSGLPDRRKHRGREDDGQPHDEQSPQHADPVAHEAQQRRA